MTCRCETLTLGDVAEQLDVSPSTVRRWTDAGRLRAVRTSGGHRRYPASEVERLRGELAGVEPASLRFVALPSGPLAPLADLLAARGDALTAAAVTALYSSPHAGWFASKGAALALEAWRAELAACARAGAYEPALAATARLGDAAERGGASLLERHLFVERLAAVAARAMATDGADGTDVVGVRRLFARVADAMLEPLPVAGSLAA